MKHSKIFIVEDDVDDIFLMEEELHEKGYREVHFVTDPRLLMPELNALPTEELPGLIITDLNMPAVSGFELLKRIKAVPRFRNIAVIVFSTSNFANDIALCLALGAKDFYTKPYTAKELSRMLDKVLEVA
jgi:CheY-like chemotaxis protein